MKKTKLWIAVALVGFIVFQSIAMPSYRREALALRQIYDDEEEELSFDKWSIDSLRMYVDSMLTSDLDSIPDDPIEIEVNDSLQAIIDSALNVIYVRDSIEKAKIAFQKWFDSIPKKEQKKWTLENVTIPAKIHRADSIQHRKDSIKAYKDSVREATPRILDTPFIPDSLQYKRIIEMKQDKRFGDIKVEHFDTSYNAHFYDYKFFNRDVNATWLGVAGSPVQLYNVYRRTEEENAVFFTPFQEWTYTPSNIPMYNTKTPYTELCYYGTPFANRENEELNARILTTQNITPELNVAFEYSKFGAGGYMQNGKTNFTNLALSGNYLGKKYSAHAGWIKNSITRKESGGFTDNMWIRDTSVASNEIAVHLRNASNEIKRNTIFLNQSFRISFGNDSLTTAFIGHSLDWSKYTKAYSDNITDVSGRDFYNNVFIMNAGKSADTMQVSKFDNKVYLRLQPWKDDSIISKIDVGVGDRLLTYKDCIFDPETPTIAPHYEKVLQNSLYAYAGAKGMYRRYFNWDANGRLFFAGAQAGDFDIDANVTFKFYPFRKQRNSPIAFGGTFHTDLTSPDHYENRILTNHYMWDNDFARKSRTKFGAFLDIPYWKLDAEAGYSILAGNIYYDNNSIARQCETPVSVISANLHKDLVLWKFHLDNRVLFQYSSNPEVVPVPMLALNLRYYLQFYAVKNVLQMQIGANALYATKWQMPGYNPNLGVFYNQTEEKFGYTPYIDVFLNLQWKQACIFIKVENINEGAPYKHDKDYFSAAGFIHTQRAIKFGITWPFYVQPGHSHVHEDNHGAGAGDGGIRTGSGGSSFSGGRLNGAKNINAALKK